MSITPPIHPVHPCPRGRNGGIVPPWLQHPPVFVLPVLPGEDDVQLPVLPDPCTTTTTTGDAS